MITVKGSVFYRKCIAVENGPLLTCPNVEGWISEGSYGYFWLIQEEEGVYKAIAFFPLSS